MIAYATITSQYSTIPIMNRVMIMADSHSQIVASIAEAADYCAKCLACSGCEYRVDSFDMKRDTSNCDELHYFVKLLVLPV
jgi:hypothetical protein